MVWLILLISLLTPLPVPDIFKSKDFLKALPGSQAKGDNIIHFWIVELKYSSLRRFIS